MKTVSETKIRSKLTVVLALIIALNFALPVRADDATSSVDTLNAQKDSLQSQLDSINQQITKYQQQIASTQSKTNSLKNEISIYDDQIASTQLEIEAEQTQIDDANSQIDEVEKLIQQKISDISDNKQVLSQLLVELNEYDNEYALKTTIASDNLSDFLDQIEYTQSLNSQIYQVVQKIEALKADLESQQTDLQAKVAQLQQFKDQLQVTQDSLQTQRDQKQTLLTQTKGLESNYQKLLAGSKSQEDDLQKEVNDLDDQIRAKLGNKTLPPSQGILAWPVNGIITQGYGNTGFTALGYTFHNGLDIAGPAGAPVYAAADGVVYDTDHSDAEFGNWVAIKHSLAGKDGPINIVTLYGHFRSFIVSKGQSVKQGDLIGYEGNTGNTTAKLYGPERGYHVHFGVYDADGFGVAQGAYQKIYGPYKVPYGYTYNPLDFLSSQ